MDTYKIVDMYYILQAPFDIPTQDAFFKVPSQRLHLQPF
jgi:hypothetical protein